MLFLFLIVFLLRSTTTNEDITVGHEPSTVGNNDDPNNDINSTVIVTDENGLISYHVHSKKKHGKYSPYDDYICSYNAKTNTYDIIIINGTNDTNYTDASTTFPQTEIDYHRSKHKKHKKSEQTEQPKQSEQPEQPEQLEQPEQPEQPQQHEYAKKKNTDASSTLQPSDIDYHRGKPEQPQQSEQPQQHEYAKKTITTTPGYDYEERERQIRCHCLNVSTHDRTRARDQDKFDKCMKKEHGNSNYDVELSSPLNNNDENMKNIKEIGFKFAAVFAILFGIIILITSIIWCFNYLYKTVRLKGYENLDARNSNIVTFNVSDV